MIKEKNTRFSRNPASCVCVGCTQSGVRSLAYDAAQHMLLSAGFEFGIKAWGVSGAQAFPPPSVPPRSCARFRLWRNTREREREREYLDVVFLSRWSGAVSLSLSLS